MNCFFMKCERLRIAAIATFKNPKISLLITKNLEVQPKTNTQKISILNLWRNWEKFMFAVENKR